MAKTLYELDGAEFTSLEGFFDQVSRKLIPGARWGHSLDAFNDVLRGGFGTPIGGFILGWKNSVISRDRLGYAETARQLRLRLARCHPTNRDDVARQLTAAEACHGDTVFDWLVSIISDHCEGGTQQEDGVELRLY